MDDNKKRLTRLLILIISIISLIVATEIPNDNLTVKGIFLLSFFALAGLFIFLQSRAGR